jgi:hypothetical protein
MSIISIISGSDNLFPHYRSLAREGFPDVVWLQHLVEISGEAKSNSRILSLERLESVD